MAKKAITITFDEELLDLVLAKLAKMERELSQSPTMPNHHKLMPDGTKIEYRPQQKAGE